MSNNDIGYKPNEKMRDIVKKHNSLILVMGRFGLPLGFGDKSVGEVCRAHNVDERTFLAVVNFVVKGICNYDTLSFVFSYGIFETGSRILFGIQSA